MCDGWSRAKLRSKSCACWPRPGIEIPFPQRDLHLRGVDPTAAGLLAGNGAMPMSAESDSDIELRSRSKRSVGGE